MIADVRVMLVDRLTPLQLQAETGLTMYELIGRIRGPLAGELMEWRGAIVDMVESMRDEGMSLREAVEFVGINRESYRSWLDMLGRRRQPPPPADDDDSVYSAPLEGFDADLELMLRSRW